MAEQGYMKWLIEQIQQEQYRLVAENPSLTEPIYAIGLHVEMLQKVLSDASICSLQPLDLGIEEQPKIYGLPVIKLFNCNINDCVFVSDRRHADSLTEADRTYRHRHVECDFAGWVRVVFNLQNAAEIERQEKERYREELLAARARRRSAGLNF